MHDNIFFQLTVIFGITVTIAFIMRLLRQPLMTAYIVAGMIAGPLFLNVMNGGESAFHAFAQFGVVLLLFVVGLSLNIHHIRRIGPTAIVSALGQLLLTVGVGVPLLHYFHFSYISALYLTIALTFSSTIIVVKILGEKKDNESLYGQHTLALLIVQDIIAIVIMMAISSTTGSSSLAQVLNVLVVRGVLLLSFIFFLAKYVLPLLLDGIAKNGEFLFIFTIAWCFGIASLLYWAGFSLEIGAIVAGVSLGSSPYQPHISSRIRPLRDFFIVLFFIILGSEISLSGIKTSLVPALFLSFFVIAVEPLLLYILYRFQKFSRRNSFLISVTASQVSEFGFILIFTGISAGHLSSHELSIFTLVALITIFVSSYVVTYNNTLYRWFAPVFKLLGPDRHVQHEKNLETFDVIVFGYHRIGWKICETLAQKGLSYAVVDFSPIAISKLKRRNIPHFFGDASDIEFLSTLPLEKATLIVSTLPEADDQIVLIEHVRNLTKKTIIIANLYHSAHLRDLYDAGASYVMMPHLLGGHWMAHVLETKPWTKKSFDDLRKEQKDEMKLRFTGGTDLE